MRVLVTEDETVMANLVSQALSEEGHDVHVVSSGERAIDAVRGSSYDLVLLDVMLPGLDGFSTCRRMRARGAGMPVLMLTARDDVDDRVRGLDAGADDYLCKPFSLDELLARVRALLRRGPAAFGARVALGDLVLDAGTLTLWRAHPQQGAFAFDAIGGEGNFLFQIARRDGKASRYQRQTIPDHRLDDRTAQIARPAPSSHQQSRRCDGAGSDRG